MEEIFILNIIYSLKSQGTFKVSAMKLKIEFLQFF